MKNYPPIEDVKTLDDVINLLRFITKERPLDVKDYDNLQNRFISGRSVGTIPTGAATTSDDRVGDFSYDENYFYLVVNNGVEEARSGLKRGKRRLFRFHIKAALEFSDPEKAACVLLAKGSQRPQNLIDGIVILVLPELAYGIQSLLLNIRSPKERTVRALLPCNRRGLIDKGVLPRGLPVQILNDVIIKRIHEHLNVAGQRLLCGRKAFTNTIECFRLVCRLGERRKHIGVQFSIRQENPASLA